MEVSGVTEIFQVSESLYGLRYTKFLGDGDARAYKAVNEMQPYGYIGIEKLECVGYVEKWIGTRLQALKLKMKDTELDKLQCYYGLAIRNNTDSINSITSMKRAIRASYFHKASIDAYPQHDLCPKTKISGVNITEQLQQAKYKKTQERLAIRITQLHQKCVHRELSTSNILAKCLHAPVMETADRERLRKANYDIYKILKKKG
ncbi:uncharacterized protein TNCV_2782931 [Trichonephila clavipes]|nr:uncharacterized protein TNCV_2782931 [Trichonephila clavipes]